MKFSPVKTPLMVRVMLSLIGTACGLLSVNAIRAGSFHMGNHGAPFDITRSQDPVAFWGLVFVFAFIAAGAFYVALARRLPNI